MGLSHGDDASAGSGVALVHSSLYVRVSHLMNASTVSRRVR